MIGHVPTCSSLIGQAQRVSRREPRVRHAEEAWHHLQTQQPRAGAEQHSALAVSRYVDISRYCIIYLSRDFGPLRGGGSLSTTDYSPTVYMDSPGPEDEVIRRLPPYYKSW